MRLRRGISRPRIICRFQYRKRYEVTCDLRSIDSPVGLVLGFNTASGMRSHATEIKEYMAMVEKAVSIPQAV